MTARLPRVDIVRNDAGQWHWRFVATNGRKQCSSETYKRRIDCVTAMTAVLSVAGPLPALGSMDVDTEAVLQRVQPNGEVVPLLTVRVLR